MKQFPEEYELIGIFESEPEVLDADVPWFYNNLKFFLKRDADVLEFEIEPSVGFIKIVWNQSDRVLINLHLENVTGMEIERKQGRVNCIGSGGQRKRVSSPDFVF